MEDAMDGNKSSQERQRSVCYSSIDLVQGIMGRPLDTTERGAFAFVLSSLWNPDANPEKFVKSLGLTGLSGNDAAQQLHAQVYLAKQQEIKRRTEASMKDPVELGKLQALGEFIESNEARAQKVRREHPDHPVYIGGVPDYWVPEWVNE